MKIMKWKKLVTLGCVVVMTVSSVTACGSNTTENQTVEATEQSEENQSDSVIVQVTAVEGDQITADVGTLTTASADASGNGAPGGEAPGGEAPSGDNSGNGAPGEAPSGDAPGGQMPGGSSFEASGESITFTLTDDTAITLEYLQGSDEGTADDIAVGSVLEVVLDEDNQAVSVTVRNLNAGGGFGGSGEVTNGTSANTITEDTEVDSETYTSTGDDENALRVDGATVTLKDITIEKTAGSSSNTEDGDFYGLNAGLLVLNGATATITGATVNTSVTNGNGVFSYGEGTVVNISDSTIRTTENNSGGI